MRGDLLDRGWGAEHGYPALALRPDGAEVAGVVLTSEALADEWERLDEFEGPGYERVLTQVTLAFGRGRRGVVVRRSGGGSMVPTVSPPVVEKRAARASKPFPQAGFRADPVSVGSG